MGHTKSAKGGETGTVHFNDTLDKIFAPGDGKEKGIAEIIYFGVGDEPYASVKDAKKLGMELAPDPRNPTWAKLNREQAEELLTRMMEAREPMFIENDGEYEDIDDYAKGGEIDMGMGYLGNGITVWDRNREVGGDYKKIAHISEQGAVSYYDKKLPEHIKNEIEAEAKKILNEGFKHEATSDKDTTFSYRKTTYENGEKIKSEAIHLTRSQLEEQLSLNGVNTMKGLIDKWNARGFAGKGIEWKYYPLKSYEGGGEVKVEEINWEQFHNEPTWEVVREGTDDVGLFLKSKYTKEQAIEKYNEGVRRGFTEYNKSRIGKYKVGEEVYSWQNPDKPAPINRVRDNGIEDGHDYGFSYRLSYPNPDNPEYNTHSKWMGEASLHKTKQEKYESGGSIHASGSAGEYLAKINLEHVPDAAKKHIQALLSDPAITTLNKEDENFKALMAVIESRHPRAFKETEIVEVPKEEPKVTREDYLAAIETYKAMASLAKGKEKKEYMEAMKTFKKMAELDPAVMESGGKVNGGIKEIGGHEVFYSEPKKSWVVTNKEGVIKYYAIDEVDAIDWAANHDERDKGFREAYISEDRYKGYTEEQIWEALSPYQREHFLQDHSHSILDSDPSLQGRTEGLVDFKYREENDYNKLPEAIKSHIRGHVMHGQYEKGGEVKLDNNLETIQLWDGLSMLTANLSKEKAEEMVKAGTHFVMSGQAIGVKHSTIKFKKPNIKMSDALYQEIAKGIYKAVERISNKGGRENLEREYRENQIRTMWSLYHDVSFQKNNMDTHPALRSTPEKRYIEYNEHFRKQTGELNDSHIDSALKSIGTQIFDKKYSEGGGIDLEYTGTYLTERGYIPTSHTYTTNNGVEYMYGILDAEPGNKAIVIAFGADDEHYLITKEDAREMAKTVRNPLNFFIKTVELHTDYGVELHSKHEKPQDIGFDKIVKVSNSEFSKGGKVWSKEQEEGLREAYISENRYLGHTPEQIWEALTPSQRIHFIEDHFRKQYTPRTIHDIVNKKHKFIPADIKEEFEKHVKKGQYEKGGAVVEKEVPDDIFWALAGLDKKSSFINTDLKIEHLHDGDYKLTNEKGHSIEIPRLPRSVEEHKIWEWLEGLPKGKTKIEIYEKGGKVDGKVIGHTHSGKPIYKMFASNEYYKDFTKEEHGEAATAHRIAQMSAEDVQTKNFHNEEMYQHAKKAGLTGNGKGTEYFVAVHENKDGYWTIASKPVSSKSEAEAMLSGTPKNETGKVVTLEEAKAHKKVLGREYLGIEKKEQGGEIKKVPEKGTPEWHHLQIAKKTVRMPSAIVGVMGGMSVKEAEELLESYGIKYTGEKKAKGGKIKGITEVTSMEFLDTVHKAIACIPASERTTGNLIEVRDGTHTWIFQWIGGKKGSARQITPEEKDEFLGKESVAKHEKGGKIKHALKIEKPENGEYWHVRFRTPEHFIKGSIRVPEWATTVSEATAKGSKVYLGRDKDTKKWAVQKVLIPGTEHKATAKKQAEDIACKLEYQCKKEME